ncbi:hypothetical protein [Microtetraspora sp. NBRC 16547]|uniref:hypothetical protein n=1 Tax=Microtetraspora sp. NBRC 16547 TaxID=3030993 RepID=UPI0024A2CB78|nr:hypothetical protein [Microtetraspora sp. NBRC 16547]GLX01116.1 hypothetical protein Misp02_52020 [Microtetraspora sp. NBRC 16547]
MARNALPVAAAAGLILLIGGVYGMSSLSTMSWGVPIFVIGLFLLIIGATALTARLARGQGPSSGVLGRMKDFMGTGNQELIGSGVPSRALITGMRDTGTMVNDQVVVEFDLQVQPAGGSPYLVSHRQILPRLLMGAVLPGRNVQVWVDPTNPQRLAIDWSALPAQSP